MSDPWAQFPDAKRADPWDQFPDANSGPSAAARASDFAYQIPVGFNKGLNAVLSAPGDVMAWGAEKLGVSKETADKFRFNNPVSQALTSGQAPTTTAGRYGEAIGHAVGASAIPSAGLLAAAPRVAAAGQAMASMTPTRAAVQQVAESIASSPMSAAGYDLASSVASGVGSQAAQEAGFGQTGQMIAGMGAAMVPGVAAGLTAGTRGMIQRARANQGEAGAYGSFVDDLGRPVRDFADDIAAGGSRMNVNANSRTLDILGEEMQRANGNRQVALTNTVDRIAAENNITPQAAQQHVRRLTSVHEDSPLMLGEYPAVAQSDVAQRMRQAQNIDLDELGRVQPNAVQSTIDYLANNGNTQSAQNTRQAVARRQEDLSPSMRQVLEDIGPQTQTGPRTTRPATIEDTSQLVEQARQVAGNEYRSAYQSPVNNRYSVHFLPMIIQANTNRALMRAGEPRAAIERALNQFYIQRPDGQRLVMQTLQQMQDARGALRGQIAEYRRSGRDDLVNAVQPIYQQISRLMSRMSPQWAQANRRWADMNFDEMAQELGDAFATKAGPRYREQIDEFRSLAPQAQNIVRVHVLQKLFDKLDNLGDTNGVSKLFTNDQSRRMIGDLFGPEASVAFARAVRNQRVAESTGAMMGNSRTHMRGMTQKQKDSETGIVTALQQGSVQNVRNWLMDRAAQLLTEHRNRPLADIATTPLSDTAQVAQHLYRMRQQEQQLRQIEAPRTTPDFAYGAKATAPLQAEDDSARRDPRVKKLAKQLSSMDEAELSALMKRVGSRLQFGGPR